MTRRIGLLAFKISQLILTCLLKILYPPHCIVCQKDSLELVCEHCRLSCKETGNFCKHCGIDLPGQIKVCGQCLSVPHPLIDILIVPFLYASIISQLIIDLKFKKRPVSAKALCFLIEQYDLKNEIQQKIRTLLALDNTTNLHSFQIIPIPIDALRLALRGFNQSLELANGIASYLFQNTHCVNDQLVNKKIGFIPQSTLDKSARKQNLHNAFYINNKKNIPNSVLLIDDVLTTGVTLFAVAKILRAAGVKNIYALTVAKA